MRLQTTRDVNVYFSELSKYKGTDHLNVIIWENDTLSHFVAELKELDTSNPINLEHILVHHSVTEEISPEELVVLFGCTKSICLPKPLTNEQREAVVHDMLHSGCRLQKLTVANSDDNLVQTLMDLVGTLKSVSQDFPGMMETYFHCKSEGHANCATEGHVTLSGITDDDIVVATEG